MRATPTHPADATPRADPALAHAVERWPDAAALRGGFTLAHGLTPMVLAASLGDVAMIDRLLAAGATADSQCACDAAEPAVLAAARHGHLDAVARLRAAGADPSLDPVVDALFAWRESAAPTVPVRAVNAWITPKPGDVLAVTGAAATGLMVLLAELSHRALARGARVVWTAWAERPWQRGEVEAVARRYGLPVGPPTDRCALQLLVGDAQDPRLLDRALATIAGGEGEVLHVLFEADDGGAATLPRLPELQVATTTLVVAPWAAVTCGERAAPTGEPWDGAITTDAAQARAGIYPCLHPGLTRRFHDPDPPARAAARAAAIAARDALAAEGVPDAVAPEGWATLRSLAEPFHAAWPDLAATEGPR